MTNVFILDYKGYIRDEWPKTYDVQSCRTFRWKFNNSGETLDVGSERFSVNGSRSILKYTPVTDQDYGTLSCWASNEVGTQNQPCLFQVVLAALPNTVSNCTIFNRTELSVDIQCIPGYDGGLPQIFVLEIFSTRTGITSKHDDVSLTLSPVIVGSVLTIVIISLAIALKIFMMTFLHNLRRNRQHGTKATATAVVAQTGDVYKGGIEKPRWQHTDIKSKSSEDLVEDERDPDVIPSQYVGSVGSGSSTSSANASIGGVSGSVGVGNGISNAATNGSVNHHFTSTSKWSPSTNQQHTKSYETNMMQQNPTGGNGGVGSETAVSIPMQFNQINARTHLLASASMMSPTATTASAATTSGTALLHATATTISRTGAAGSSGGSGAAVGLMHDVGNIIGSPTSLASTSTIAATTHLQQQLHSSGVGTLPPGLGTGGGYILNSLINSSSGTAMSSLHHTSATCSPSAASSSSSSTNANASNIVGGMMGGGSIGRVNLHHSTLHHHNTLGSRGNHGHYTGHPSPSTMMLTSQTTSALSGGSGSTPGSTTGVGLLLGSHSLPSAAPSTTTTSCNSSTDLDDNINIMAIKDCLMTQRVPESCV
ncbi:mucin-19-like [Lucilia cuprina]|uniref:mucin-19-like n=1 Tax=Lucilia cuprina TaxID=7375 RepID=UPI001F05C821|nr:mucin-19-like [Lucilia cuprina]